MRERDAARATVLVGPPGAGCTSVGAALAALTGTALADLGELVAAELGTTPELALVAVAEEDYRRVEAATALALLQETARVGGVVALGSGCLEDDAVVTALEALRGEGARVVALTASPRRLATRNGLDAPRSVGLGNVHHEFVQMLREREAQCRALADETVDTSEWEPREIARAIAEA